MKHAAIFILGAAIGATASFLHYAVRKRKAGFPFLKRLVPINFELKKQDAKQLRELLFK
jgi:hypothetical protein